MQFLSPKRCTRLLEATSTYPDGSPLVSTLLKTRRPRPGPPSTFGELSDGPFNRVDQERDPLQPGAMCHFPAAEVPFEFVRYIAHLMEPAMSIERGPGEGPSTDGCTEAYLGRSVPGLGAKSCER
ncbi:hypothetical protein AB1N83_004216 [Pleurotus pulmonarius]